MSICDASQNKCYVENTFILHQGSENGVIFISLGAQKGYF